MRMALLALLYAAVLLIQLTLPEGSPLREATGGSASLWLILGGVGVIVALYTAVLKRLRERVEANDNTPEMQKSEAPFRDVELDRYARHIVLREVGGPDGDPWFGWLPANEFEIVETEGFWS